MKEGIIITDDVIMFPFLIPPFCDRVLFWNYILKHFGRDKINGVLEDDASVLPMFGYKVSNMSQVMCRPTDTLTYNLANGFICRPLDIWESVYAMCNLFHTLALAVAVYFDFTYRQEEENGTREYLRMVKEHAL
jgi:hypothetical protein